VNEIGIICFANYCRSPVAEKLLNQKDFQSLSFKSYGIEPLVRANMDIRSIKFLEKNRIKNTEHMPKKIDANHLSKSKIILCMDHYILMIMNKKFPRFRKKYKLFSFKLPSLKIDDPYKFEDKDYELIMERILTIVENIQEVDLLE
tara:strand:- start:754 stop:1191 length:438 start_codon:yes stop_codon:yes gene_type:complete